MINGLFSPRSHSTLKKTEFVHTLSQLHGRSAITDVVSAQDDSGDLRGVAGGDGELGCLCGKAGTSVICVMAPPIHLTARCTLLLHKLPLSCL